MKIWHNFLNIVTLNESILLKKGIADSQFTQKSGFCIENQFKESWIVPTLVSIVITICRGDWVCPGQLAQRFGIDRRHAPDGTEWVSTGGRRRRQAGHASPAPGAEKIQIQWSAVTVTPLGIGKSVTVTDCHSNSSFPRALKWPIFEQNPSTFDWYMTQNANSSFYLTLLECGCSN